jgi:hypothetical protein
MLFLSIVSGLSEPIALSWGMGESFRFEEAESDDPFDM